MVKSRSKHGERLLGSFLLEIDGGREHDFGDLHAVGRRQVQLGRNQQWVAGLVRLHVKPFGQLHAKPAANGGAGMHAVAFDHRRDLGDDLPQLRLSNGRPQDDQPSHAQQHPPGSHSLNSIKHAAVSVAWGLGLVPPPL